MTDVGHLANVSYETVSRVLHGHPGVRPATRARVLSAIEQLGYKPNKAPAPIPPGSRRKWLGRADHRPPQPPR